MHPETCFLWSTTNYDSLPLGKCRKNVWGTHSKLRHLCTRHLSDWSILASGITEAIFFAAAAEAMRRILVENARRKQSQKRGGNYDKIHLDELTISITGPSDDIIEISEALDKLAVQDQAVADLVKLHYFSGLTLDQVAQLQGMARRTVAKHLAYARAWLRREMCGDNDAASK